MNPNFRKVRLIQWSLIASILIFAGIAETVCGRGKGEWTIRHWLVTGLALWAAFGGFRIRHRFLRRSTEALAKDAVNPKSLRQWEVGNVVGLVMAAGVAMWGLVVRFCSWWWLVASVIVLRGWHISAIALDPTGTNQNSFKLKTAAP